MVLLFTGVSLYAAETASAAVPDRPEGPCDIYHDAGIECWAAHSTTRALLKSYTGPLYQVRRLSDNTVKDIPIVEPSEGDAGGYADAAVQDAFCAGTYCEISRVYDQSGKGNDLYRAPGGGANGLMGAALGGNDNNPAADWGPVMVYGHKVYGMTSTRGMGMRNNSPTDAVTGDDPASDYWVVDGGSYADGCCFGYGNGETDSRDLGNGTMEAMAFGSSRSWHYGLGPGPWSQTDQENNLVSCNGTGTWLGLTGYNERFCEIMPSVTWRFHAAFADFGKYSPANVTANGGHINNNGTDNIYGGNWASRGANLQADANLTTYWDGDRVNSSYAPMRKQGGIYYGTGGDNSISTQGTMYEGAMAHNQSNATVDQKIYENIREANYQEVALEFAPAGEIGTAGNNQMTFGPGVSKQADLSFTNRGTAAATGLTISVASSPSYTISLGTLSSTSVAAGTTVTVPVTITGTTTQSNDDLTATATWTTTSGGVTQTQTTTAIMHTRNTSQIKINEYSIQTTGDTTNSYIELYNSGDTSVDISNWTITLDPMQQAVYSTITVPAGTNLAAHDYYTLGLSTSGLAAPSAADASTIYVRSATGLTNGTTVTIGTGANAETRQIVGTVGAETTPSLSTAIWQPQPPICQPVNCSATDEPAAVYGPGTSHTDNLPVQSTTGFAAGRQVLVGYGATQEILTVASVGTAGNRNELAPTANAVRNGTAVTTTGSPAGNIAAGPATGFANGQWNAPVTNVAGWEVGGVPYLYVSGTTNIATAGVSFWIGIGDKEEEVTTAGTPITCSSSSHANAACLNNFTEAGWINSPLTAAETTPITVASTWSGLTTFYAIPLTTALKYTHPNTDPFGTEGTGITFTTPMQFNHSSRDPIIPLGTGMTLSAPLENPHPINDVIEVAGATNAGYQGTPDQWFGGPAFSTSGGSIVVKTPAGLISDSLNYGFIPNPGYAEGMQRLGAYAMCVAPVPGADVSAGRYPDGNDTDSNCKDFLGATRTPDYESAFSEPAGPLVSIQFARDTDQYIIHNDREIQWGKVGTDPEDMANASFYAVPALNGNAGCVSFLAYNQPGFYIRGVGPTSQVMTLLANDASSGFATAASFCPVSQVGTGSTYLMNVSGGADGVRFRFASNTASYLRPLYIADTSAKSDVGMYGENGVFAGRDGVINLPQPGDTPTNFAIDIVWNVVDGLVLDVNKAELQKDMDTANSLHEEYYTPESWAVLAAEMPQSQAVLDTFGGPDQATIDARDAVLKAALDQLVSAPVLNLEVSPALGMVLPGSVTLTATLLGDDVAGKPIVFTQNGEILRHSPSDPAGVLTNASGVATFTITNPDPGQYTYGAYFDGDQENLAATANNEVNYTVAPTRTVVLEALVAVGTEIQAEIQADPEFYTDLSVAHLNEAMLNAQSVLANPNATDDQIDQAIAQMETALEGMTPKGDTPDYTILTAVYNIVAALTNPDCSSEPLCYPAASWDAFQSALADAKQVLDNPNATQAQINAALVALVAARDGLNLEEPSGSTGGPTTEPPTGGPTGAPTTTPPAGGVTVATGGSVASSNGAVAALVTLLGASLVALAAGLRRRYLTR